MIGSSRPGGPSPPEDVLNRGRPSSSKNLPAGTNWEVWPLTSPMVARIWVPPNYGFLLIKCNSLSRLGVLSGRRRSGPDGCCSKMILNAKFVPLRRSPRNGFSLVGLVPSLAVLLVTTALAVPVVVRSLQTYLLNSTAAQLSGLLKFTKFDAVRGNRCGPLQSLGIGRGSVSLFCGATR